MYLYLILTELVMNVECSIVMNDSYIGNDGYSLGFCIVSATLSDPVFSLPSCLL